MTDPKATYDPGDQFLPAESSQPQRARRVDRPPSPGGERAGRRAWLYWAVVAIGAAMAVVAIAWEGLTAARAGLFGP